eukprot:403335692
MTSKAFLNNMQIYKKRDASLDQHMKNRFINNSDKSDKIILPQLKMGAKVSVQNLQNGQLQNQNPNNHAAVANPLKASNYSQIGNAQGSNEIRYRISSKHRSIDRNISLYKNQKQHSRMASIEYPSSGQCSTQQSTAQLSAISSGFLNLNIEFKNQIPKQKYDIVSDYAKSIDLYMQQLQQQNLISSNFLEFHKINGVYRAKMIDWMVEVLTAFKSSDQTFFLAVNLMDRYFDALAKQNITLQLNELHITGVCCMFMASKYEDVYPILMKTVFVKIGHSKISVEAIRAKEMQILRAIGFSIGSLPTLLEFQQNYLEQAFKTHEDSEFIKLMSVYLGKMALHHEHLCYKQSSLLATSTIYVALKICEQMRQKQILTKPILQNLLDVSGIEEKRLIDCSKKVLYLAQNFEKELPGLQNVKEAYIPLLNKFFGNIVRVGIGKFQLNSNLLILVCAEYSEKMKML